MDPNKRILFIDLCVAMVKQVHKGTDIQKNTVVTIDADKILEWLDRNNGVVVDSLLKDDVSLRAAMGYEHFCHDVCSIVAK
jgi:hypothetical protein